MGRASDGQGERMGSANDGQHERVVGASDLQSERRTAITLSVTSATSPAGPVAIR